MRISDWSSDVCSSDLFAHELIHADPLGERRIDVHRFARDAFALFLVLDEMQRAHVMQPIRQLDQQHTDVVGHGEQEFARSEEHTSELQSLMRISYAVFCLKKNKNIEPNHNKSNIIQDHITSHKSNKPYM